MKNTSPRLTRLSALVILMLLTLSTSAFAQGNIFGPVTNSDLSTPANGEISFFGFLDDTDEEIRIETSDGAGYDAGNWFDDFQNYLTEGAGNPYDYYFYNVVNGEAFHLGKLIPSNGFQEEPIQLAANTWPTAPGGLTGTAVSSTAVILYWNKEAGLTYHVYRRAAASNGSFFRLDAPTGSLSNRGVVDSFFVDNTVSGGGSYQYVLIGEDDAGNLSAHSSILTVNSASLTAPVLTSIDPATGSIVGGLLVNVYGSDFDAAGMTVTFGAAIPVAATVLSPYHATVVVPAGTAGAVDVTLTNTASALASNALTGGFTYDSNTPPVMATIGSQTVVEGAVLAFAVTANDAEGTTPALTSTALPGSATYVDNGDGTGSFNWATTFTDAGVYNVTFYATDAVDPTLVDSEVVQITVNDAGNQRPVLAPIANASVAEGGNLNFGISASDADNTIPALSAIDVPTNATFTDNGDGTGAFDFNPDLTQAGVYTVTFIASDGTLADSQAVQITVTGTNQAPVLAAIADASVVEGANLNFAITATDPDGTTPALSALSLPVNATLTDNGDGSATFDFSPDYIQAGPYAITFIASDGFLADSQAVLITVDEAGNQRPVLAAIADASVPEGGNLNFAVTATDADSTTPTLLAINLPPNAAFTNNLDGTGTFDFSPDFDQEGVYPVTFIATDGSLADSQVVQITVNGTNLAPVLNTIADESLTEGDSVVVTITATDPDGNTIELTADNLPLNADLTDNGDGSGVFRFKPDYTQAGDYTVTFIASDGLLADSQDVSITVLDAGNQPPTLTVFNDTTIFEGDSLSVLITAVDLDGQMPILSAIDLPTGAVFTDSLNGVGLFEFTPTYTQSGVYSIRFIASDGVLADTQTVVVTVTDLGNMPPVFDQIADTSVNEGGVLMLTVHAVDPDGAANEIPDLSINTTLKHYTFVDNADGTGTFTYSPDYYDAGVVTVNFLATDAGTPQQTGVLAVKITTVEVNQAPTFVPIDPLGVTLGDVLEYTVYAKDSTDANAAHRLILSVTNPPANFSFVDNGDNSGTLIFEPDSSQIGGVSVTFLAVDQGTPSLSATLNANINVVVQNAPATIGPDPAINQQIVLEGETLQYGIIAADPEGGTPILSARNLPDNSSFTDNGDGTGLFTFDPDFMQGGNSGNSRLYYVEFRAYDGFTITRKNVIFQVNDAGDQLPVFDSIPTPSVVEGETVVTKITAYDPDGEPVTLSVVESTLPTNAVFADSGNGLCTIEFTPDFRQAGTYDVQIIATAGPSEYMITVTITVEDAGPQAPTLDPIADQTVTETRVLEFTVSAQDPDAIVPADFPLLSAAPLPEEATFVDHRDGTGTFTWKPSDTAAGVYDIQFKATDVYDAQEVDSLMMQITVVDTNRAPLGTQAYALYPEGFPDPIRINEGDSAIYFVSGIDPDKTIPSIRAHLDGLETLAPNMVMVDSGNGSGVLKFYPDYTQGLPSPGKAYYIRFELVDAVDPNLTFPIGPVTIFVLNANKPPYILYQAPGVGIPVVSVGPYTIPEGDSVVFTVLGRDDDATTKPTVACLNLPANATFTGTNETKLFRFLPDFTQAGIYDLAFEATDVGGAKDTSYVSITVTDAGNQAPVFSTTLTTETSVPTSAGIQIVLNSTDPDGDPLTLTMDPVLPNASFVDNGDGTATFAYQPDVSEIGSLFTVSFIAADDQGLTDTLTTAIAVVDFLRGDFDLNSKYTMNDLADLISYVYREGPPPSVYDVADVDGDGLVNLVDITFMIKFLYFSGPPPPR